MRYAVQYLNTNILYRCTSYCDHDETGIVVQRVVTWKKSMHKRGRPSRTNDDKMWGKSRSSPSGRELPGGGCSRRRLSTGRMQQEKLRPSPGSQLVKT